MEIEFDLLILNDPKVRWFRLHNSQLNGKGRVSPVSPETTGLDDALRGAQEEDLFLTLRDLIQVIRRRLFVILLVAIIVAGAAVAFSLSRTPIYEASVLVLVGQEGSTTTGNLSNEVQGLQQLTETVARSAETRTVAQDVVDTLGLSMSLASFQENLAVEQVPRTQYVEVSYEDPSPEQARLIANAIGDALSERISEVSPNANTITATVFERAVAPEEPVSPDPVRDGLLALALGLALGVGLAFLLEYLGNNWRSPDEVEQVSGVPTFAVIPTYEKEGS